MAPGRIRDGVALTNALAAGAPGVTPDDVAPASEPLTVGGVEFREIADDDVDRVVALWEACGLTRPWNDPRRDVADARAGATSTILVAHAADAAADAEGGASSGEPADTAIVTDAPDTEGVTTPRAAAPVVATVMVGHDGHRGWMYYLAVAPARQGSGLGRDAVGAAEAWLVAQGVRKARLMVRASNSRVLGFYESLGYTDAECVVLGRDLA